MTGEDLKSCTEGTKLTYVVGEGAAEKRYPAVRRHSGSGWVMITVKYAEDDKRSFRWSTITNQPSHESRGYVGTVKLEPRA